MCNLPRQIQISCFAILLAAPAVGAPLEEHGLFGEPLTDTAFASSLEDSGAHHVTVMIEGSDNAVEIVQTGSGSALEVHIDGDCQDLHVLQVGGANQAAVYQHGHHNTVYLSQGF